MSRIGRKPIPLPKEVEVRIEPGNRVTVKGPLGTLTASFHPALTIRVEEGVLRVERPSDERPLKALHGTTRALLYNMVVGVTQGYQRGVEVVGTGYRVAQSGDRIVFTVGYARPVEYTPPPGVTVKVEGTNRVLVSGPDKQLVGQVVAQMRALKPPDPYKGKGIRYIGEQVKLRPGKTAAGRGK